MGQNKITKKITPTNKQRIQPPRGVKTQQNLNPKKRVGPRKIVVKEEPEEPPRKTRARDRLISGNSSIPLLFSPFFLFLFCFLGRSQYEIYVTNLMILFSWRKSVLSVSNP